MATGRRERAFLRGVCHRCSLRDRWMHFQHRVSDRLHLHHDFRSWAAEDIAGPFRVSGHAPFDSGGVVPAYQEAHSGT